MSSINRLLVAASMDERAEVNTASILAWAVLVVVALTAVGLVFDDIVTEVLNDVKDRILGITS